MKMLIYLCIKDETKTTRITLLNISMLERICSWEEIIIKLCLKRVLPLGISN